MTGPFELAAEAAAAIEARLGRHDVALVLGSGWREAAAGLGTLVAEVDATEFPGFLAPTVLGHGGTLRSIQHGQLRVLASTGRVHGYEGHDPHVVVHGVRAAVLNGCSVVILTNAAGSVDPANGPGQPVLIADHINYTGKSSLTGPLPPAPWDVRFIDMTDTYSPRLRAAARAVDPALPEAVYMGFNGPQFETPAEIRMAAALGAGLVGMSTVLEAIAARHLGAEVLGISLSTNLAAGVSPTPLDHEEVLAAGRDAGPRMAALLDGIVAGL
jgi:purine-nucleoside phosphorylase